MKAISFVGQKSRSKIRCYTIVGFLCCIVWVQLPTFAQPQQQAQDLSGTVDQLDELTEAQQFHDAAALIEATSDAFFLATDTLQKADYAYAAGDVYHYLSKFILAESYYRKALTFYRVGDDQEAVAETYFALAENALFLGRYEQSLELGHKALNIYQTLNDELNAADLKGFISRVLVRTGNLDEATAFTLENRAFYASLGDTVSMLLTDEDLAYLLVDKGEFDTAFTIAQQTLAKFTAWGDVDGIITSSHLMGILHTKLDEHQTAIGYFEKCIETIDTLEDKRNIHAFYREMGEAEMRLEQYQKAHFHYDEFFTLGTNVGDQNVAVEYHDLKRHLYAIQGNYHAALRYSIGYENARDSLDEMETKKVISELNVKYATAQKDQQLQLSAEQNGRLQEQNELLEQKRALTRSRISFWALIVTSLIIIAIIVVAWQRLKLKNANLRAQHEKELAESELLVSNRALEARSKELQDYTASVLEKNQLIERFEAELAALSKLDDAQQIERNEKLESLYQLKILTNEDWWQYKKLFEEVHPNFLPQLRTQSPDLTEGDKRYLMLTYLGIASKEMAQILGVSQSSLRVSKFRLRKKLELPEEQELQHWLAARFTES
jgi:tetratricopeptide (TPR) repeat protein